MRASRAARRALSTAAAPAVSFVAPPAAPLVFRAPLAGGAAGVEVLALNNAPVNALSADVLGELAAALRAAAADRGCAALVLASAAGGAGPFSAGLDVREMAGASEAAFARFWGAVQDVFLALWTHPKPVAAALEGAAPAGGCWLALQADHRVLVDDARALIGLNETALGIVAPVYFSEPLVRAVGARRAEELLQLGALLPPARALATGLVDELAPRGAVLNAAASAAARYAAVPRAARAATKAALRGALAADALGSAEKRAVDLAATWAFMSAKPVQAGLHAYLATLSKKKA